MTPPVNVPTAPKTGIPEPDNTVPDAYVETGFSVGRLTGIEMAPEAYSTRYLMGNYAYL